MSLVVGVCITDFNFSYLLSDNHELKFICKAVEKNKR